jgi:MFS family permease
MRATGASKSRVGQVLLVLGLAQYVLMLDTTVMNVSIAQLVEDLDTTVTRIQLAITMFTLVMATTMIAGGKIGDVLGRRRTFRIGLVVYGLGSGITSIAPNFAVLLLGWSLLEGLGSALLMPCITALIATNVVKERRASAYGFIAAMAAAAVATGPLIGGFMTTQFSWRWVFAGESVVCALIFARTGVLDEGESGVERARFDAPGAVLSALALGFVVIGVLQGGAWGFVAPATSGSPRLLGVSLAAWLVAGGLVLVRITLGWFDHAVRTGRPSLVDPAMFRVKPLTNGLTVLMLQALVQAGTFFALPIFLTVVLGLTAMKTGVTIMPLSITLVGGAVLRPKLWPKASPRTLGTVSFVIMLLGVLGILGAITADANPSQLVAPLLVMGLGIGLLASQTGDILVSSVPVDKSGEVGGLQYTAQNLGASLGTAVIGAIMLAGLATALQTGVDASPALSQAVKEQATITIDGPISFVSDPQLEAAVARAGVSPAEGEELLQINRDARLLALRRALAAVVLLVLVGLLVSRKLPEAIPRPDEGLEPETEPAGL